MCAAWGLAPGPAQEPRAQVPSQDLRCAVGGLQGPGRQHAPPRGPSAADGGRRGRRWPVAPPRASPLRAPGPSCCRSRLLPESVTIAAKHPIINPIAPCSIDHHASGPHAPGSACLSVWQPLSCPAPGPTASSVPTSLVFKEEFRVGSQLLAPACSLCALLLGR